MPSSINLIIDGAAADNQWTLVEDDAALSATDLPEGPIIVSLARLKAEGDTLAARNAPLGVMVKADGDGKTSLGEDIRDVQPFLDNLSLVALHFPTYRNGRGYSAARILREEFNYQGEIRATGEVLYDQWAMMNRCGINAFELADNISLETFKTALGELSGAYQPAADQNKGALWARSTK